MNEIFVPLGNRICVARLDIESQKNENGIQTSTGRSGNTWRGEVVSRGEKSEILDIGDIVVCTPNSGMEITIENDRLVQIMREEAPLGFFKKSK